MIEKPGKINSRVKIEEGTSDADGGLFPIVGIGASAGGLEALEQFLGNVPENSGLAFVVIQHLDPTQKGMLPELLQRITKMRVFLVKDGLVVFPNCVYVIPPNKSMSISNGKLRLFKPLLERGLRLPIDFFFNSLANDQHERGIGIILSGMGSDGSIGLSSIKDKNGTVLVQEPSSAKYDSMPNSAINSVLVDIIAPANELPAKLMTYLKQIPIIKSDIDFEINDFGSLEKIINLLRNHTGNDFSLYKKNTLFRRIDRRMKVHKIDKISSYVSFLEENPIEVNILFKELLIGVTNFFRDNLVWEHLKNIILPFICANLPAGYMLRAWVPGCSTGEEAYTLAIIFEEVIEKINPKGGISLQIFATDIDNDAIDFARIGMFSTKISDDISADRLTRFFNKTNNGYRIKTEIKEMVVFAQHNIIQHPPFTKIDILSCRNLLIYMDAELQKKMLSLFYYSINPDGIMILGSSETIGTQNPLFTTVDMKLKIFKRTYNVKKSELLDFPSSFSSNRYTKSENQISGKTIQNIQTLADQLLLQRFSPAGVLVNENGDIIYFSGRTGKYLEPAVGKANLNIFAMIREGLRNEFSTAFNRAILKKEDVFLRNIKVDTNGGSQKVNVNILWIDKPEPLKGMLLIIFNDVIEIPYVKTLNKKGRNTLDTIRQTELEEEVKQLRIEIQITLEEMQTTQEEQKSSNEELQSTNEELQSTNEELKTSKEEMQSLNEELQTVNAELQSKIGEFFLVNNDMINLLNSTDIATLYLDKELNIRRYTNQSTKIFKLIKSDIGRPFTDLVSDLEYPDMPADAIEVLRTLVTIQKQIPTKDGRWFSIRIMPYHTHLNKIDGLVLTFVNHSDFKHVELKLHETEQMNRLLLKSSSDIIIKLSTDWKILEYNNEAAKFFGKKYEKVINKDFIQMFIPEKDRSKTEKGLNKFLKESTNGKIIMQVLSKGGKLSIIDWSINVLFNNLNIAVGMIFITKNTIKL